MTTNMTDEQARRYATYASLAVAFVLILTKLTAYLLTDSVALLSTLIDSCVDLMASGVAAYGVAHALRPPDKEHRFGHGKAEPLASLFQSAFIVGSAIFLSFEAFDRFYQPRELQDQSVGYAVMGLAIVLTFILVQFQQYVVKRTGSLAVGADRLHYAGDVLINLAVIVTLLLQQWTDLPWIDPLFALGIAGVLLRGAYLIAKQALSVLLDAELADEDREKIISVATSHSRVVGAHDVRTRSDSGHIFIEIHLEMDGKMPLYEAHDIAEEVAQQLEAVYPGADVLVHQDPAGIKEKRLDSMIGTNQGNGAL